MSPVAAFSSRWVEPPETVTDRSEGGLAAGFRAAGVPAGIKPSGDPDLALLVSSEPDTVSAARFTRSGVLAAPVLLCQARCRLDALRAVVANSGNANAATGNRGLEDAARMQGAAAMAAGVHEEQVAVASTGVIGVRLPMDGIPRGMLAARGELVSCYVTPAREAGPAELLDLYDDAYAREPWVELRDGPPGVLEVRDTNYCRLSVHSDPRTGRILAFATIDNLWKGAASQAVQNLNLMFGCDEREGLT